MFNYTEVKTNSKMQAISYELAFLDICQDLKGIVLANDLVSFINEDKDKLSLKIFNSIDDVYSKFSNAYLAFLYLNQYKLKNNDLSNKVDQMCNFHLYSKLISYNHHLNLNRLIEKLKMIISNIEKFKLYIRINEDHFLENLDHLNGEFLKIDEEFYRVITSIHVKKAE